MNLPLTSLIPTVVELISFWEKNWPDIWWYPYWYLGVPMRFITGPIVPLTIILIRKILPVSTVGAYISLIGLMSLIGGIGVKFFIRELGGGKRQQTWGMVFFWILPLQLLPLITGNGLGNIAIGIVPWIWWTWSRLLREKSHLLTTAILIALVLLINPATILALAVGMVILIFLGKKTEWVESLIKLSIVLIAGICIATMWYTPRFWFTLLFNPSFAGKPLGQVVLWLVQIVQALIPLVIGIWVVQKRFRLSSRLGQFAILFFSSFGFLTIMRFISDVDFWIDWTGYFLELQLGTALIGGYVVSRYWKRWLVWLMILVIAAGGYMLLRLPKSLMDYQENYKKEVVEIVKTIDYQPETRFFFSGSPVFWINSALDTPLMQVRGGRDDASIHKTWAMGAYQIREGDSSRVLPLANPNATHLPAGRQAKGTPAVGVPRLASPVLDLSNSNGDLVRAWMQVLGVKYVLVHGPNSQEYFHDFKNLERFDSLTLVSEAGGNRLYKNEAASIAHIASQEILDLPKPKTGNDSLALEKYLATLQQPLPIIFNKPSQIQIKLPNSNAKDTVVGLAVSFDPGWTIDKGEIKSDVYGNLVTVLPAGQEIITLSYRENISFWLPGIVLSLFSLVLIFKIDSVVGVFKKRLTSIGIENQNEEEKY